MTVLERATILPGPFTAWFAGRGWTPRAHRLDLLAKAQAGRSVLLIAPTGGGKTLAGFLPSLVELSDAAGRLARNAYREVRDEWSETIRSNNEAVLKLLTYYFDTLHKLLFEQDGRLRYPQPAR